MTADIVCNFSYIGVVQGGIDLVQYEKWCWLIAACELLKHWLNIENKKKTQNLWMAKSNAKAATVFSPPESCSMSLNRFIGGMAWYLIPPL
jgi:hypothetical protein